MPPPLAARATAPPALRWGHRSARRRTMVRVIAASERAAMRLHRRYPPPRKPSRTRRLSQAAPSRIRAHRATPPKRSRNLHRRGTMVRDTKRMPVEVCCWAAAGRWAAVRATERALATATVSHTPITARILPRVTLSARAGTTSRARSRCACSSVLTDRSSARRSRNHRESNRSTRRRSRRCARDGGSSLRGATASQSRAGCSSRFVSL